MDQSETMAVIAVAAFIGIAAIWLLASLLLARRDRKRGVRGDNWRTSIQVSALALVIFVAVAVSVIIGAVT